MDGSLLVHTAGQKSTIHHQNLTSNKSGGITGQKDRRANQLYSLPEASHRRPHQQLLAAIALVQQLLVECSPEDPRRNRIHGHTLRAPLHRERLRQRANRSFTRSVRRDLLQAHKRIQ